MKNAGKKLNETLDNLIVESEQTCAPTADAVLALVRQEKTARSRRRQAAGVLTILALGITSIVLLQPDRAEPQQTIAQTSPAEPVPSTKPPKESETLPVFLLFRPNFGHGLLAKPMLLVARA